MSDLVRERDGDSVAAAEAGRPQLVAARMRADVVALVPGGLAVAIMIAWAATGGGYETQPALGAGYGPDSWYLGALALIGLFAVATLGLWPVRPSRLVAAGLGAFSAYVAWSYLSTLWANDQGSAFLGSNRALVYLAVFAMFAILPWRASSVTLALGVLVAGFGTIAVITAVKVGTVSDPAGMYIAHGRLGYPLGYENASAALFMLTAMTSVALCAQRRAPAALRVGGLVLAAVCLQLAVLSQSRGWLFTVPIIVLLTLTVLPGRLRLLVFALGPAAAAAAAAPALLKVYAAASVGGKQLVEPQLHQVLHVRGRHAAGAMLLADAVLLVAMIAAVALDRRVQISEPALRRVNRLAAACAVLAVLAGVAVGLLVTHGHVVWRIENAWNSFSNAGSAQSGSSRYTSLGSQRVDFWRVSLHEFARHPLGGIGQDNFAEAYLQHRRTGDEPRWVHSLELRLLTHTGVVGLALLLSFLVAAIAAALRSPRAGLGARVAAATALVPLIVWLVHGSIDWFWEFPVLSVPALAFLGAATALARAPSSAGPGAAHARWRVLSATAAAGVTIAALAILAIPYIAARDVQRALTAWANQPALAYRELHDAADLVPFNAQPDLVGGAIALNRGDSAAARTWLQAAVRRDGHGWLARFALGLLAVDQHRRGEARRDFAIAHELNPADPLITTALARSSTRHPLTLADVHTSLSQRSLARFGR